MSDIEVTMDCEKCEAFQYERGRADRTQEFQKQFDMLYANKLEQVRTDERSKVIKQLLADLNPCVFCHNNIACDKDYFFEDCANEDYISWNELRLRIQKLKEQRNE